MLMDAMVPISRFNKGEAGKIFEEVTSSGVKIVVKNNTPICVLINWDKYKALMEIVENYQLLVEAEQRMRTPTPSDFVKQDDLMKKLQIKEDDWMVVRMWNWTSELVGRVFDSDR